MTGTYLRSYVAGFLEAKQVSGATSALEVPEVDVVFAVSSWEPRCLAIRDLGVGKARVGIWLQFLEMGELGNRQDHDSKLGDWIATKCESVIPIEGVSAVDEQRMFPALRRAIADANRVLGRPVKVLVDVSCCPKAYILFIIGFALNSGCVSDLHLFYAQAFYSKETTDALLSGRQERKSYRFTEGEWRGVEIPYLLGLENEGRRCLLVALGFEGRKVRKFLRAYDPDVLRTIICNPGFKEEYTRAAEKENKALMQEWDIKAGNVAKFAAGDMVSVFRHAYLWGCELSGHESAFFAGLGTKAHAIGLGLAGLVLGNIAVIARMPERFVEKKSEPDGVGWLYSIRDLSALPSDQ